MAYTLVENSVSFLLLMGKLLYVALSEIILAEYIELFYNIYDILPPLYLRLVY